MSVKSFVPNLEEIRAFLGQQGFFLSNRSESFPKHNSDPFVTEVYKLIHRGSQGNASVGIYVKILVNDNAIEIGCFVNGDMLPQFAACSTLAKTEIMEPLFEEMLPALNSMAMNMQAGRRAGSN